MTEGPWTVDLTGMGRPPTVNAVGRAHWGVKRRIAEDWKAAAFAAAVELELPHLEVAWITSQAHYRNGVLTDADACALPAKGAVDGLVTAGVLPDDNAGHLLALIYLAPYKDPTRDHGLELVVYDAMAAPFELGEALVWHAAPARIQARAS